MKESTLVTARKNAGLTQLDAAKKIGVNVRTLRKWEKGMSYPPKYFVERKICALYGVSESDIITKEEHQSENIR